MTDDPKLIVALDCPTDRKALDLAARLDPARCRFKVGKGLFTRYGPRLVTELVDRGYTIFLDLKFHDIPNTVAAACKAAAELGVWMINVHAAGGMAMMQAARAALGEEADRPRLIAVTLLTSLEESDLQAIGCPNEPVQQVLRLADLARKAGLDGVVCSPQEAAGVRRQAGTSFLIVAPGIRPNDHPPDDQKRTCSVRDALAAGADYLVVGRPIWAASDPLAALEGIEREIVAGGREP